MQTVPPTGKVDTGLAALAMLARYYQVAADPKQLSHYFGTHGKTFDAVISASQLEQLVSAMAAFGEPSGGEITLTPEEESQTPLQRM